MPLGISRCTALSADETIGIFGRASILPLVGGLHAQLGEFARAREFIDEAEYQLTELGAFAAEQPFAEPRGRTWSSWPATSRRLRRRFGISASTSSAFEIPSRWQPGPRSSRRPCTDRGAWTMPSTGRLYRGRTLRAMTRARSCSSYPSRRSFVRERARCPMRFSSWRLPYGLPTTPTGCYARASTRLARAAVLRLADLEGEAETAIREGDRIVRAET